MGSFGPALLLFPEPVEEFDKETAAPEGVACPKSSFVIFKTVNCAGSVQLLSGCKVGRVIVSSFPDEPICPRVILGARVEPWVQFDPVVDRVVSDHLGEFGGFSVGIVVLAWLGGRVCAVSRCCCECFIGWRGHRCDWCLVEKIFDADFLRLVWRRP